MIPVPSGVRVWIAAGHTDMRCGMNSLALRIQQAVRMLSRIGDEGIETQRLRNLTAGFANGALVINNQDFAHSSEI